VLPEGKQFGGRGMKFRPSGQQTCPFEQSSLVVQYTKVIMQGAAIMGRSGDLARASHFCPVVHSESERQVVPSDSSVRLPQPSNRSQAESPMRTPHATFLVWHSLKR
jgi:hypothetical protein